MHGGLGRYNTFEAGYTTAFCPDDELLARWWPDTHALAETGFSYPTNNVELSEFLNKYSRSGRPKAVRYMGRA